MFLGWLIMLCCILQKEAFVQQLLSNGLWLVAHFALFCLAHHSRGNNIMSQNFAVSLCGCVGSNYTYVCGLFLIFYFVFVFCFRLVFSGWVFITVFFFLSLSHLLCSVL